jgi:hypothetical protein
VSAPHARRLSPWLGIRWALGTFYDFGPIGLLGELAPFLTLKGTDRAPSGAFVE